MRKRLLIASWLILLMLLIIAVAGCGHATTTTVGVTKDPTTLTLAEAATAIRNGDISSEKLTEALLAKIEKTTDLNAFITVDGSRALEAARQIDADIKAGKKGGVLLGVPLVVKDNIHDHRI